MRDLSISVRGIEQPVKIEAAAGAKISAQLFRELLLALDPVAIARRRELHHALMSERRSRVSRQQLAQLVEFEHALAGVLDGDGRASSRLWFYGTGGDSVGCIWPTRRLAAAPGPNSQLFTFTPSSATVSPARQIH